MNLGLLPYGGEALVKRRLAGHGPRDMVIVSCVGFVPAMFQLNSAKFIVHPDRKYDWRFLTGLEICLLVQPGIPGINRLIEQVAGAVKPHSQLYAWDVERLVGCELFWLPKPETMSKPVNKWEWKVDPMPWTAWQNDQYLIS